MTTLRWGSATDVGVVRESNQDSVLVAAPLFAVADGMGGHQGGEVASATALEVLEGTFKGATSSEQLLEAVRRANAKVWDKAQLDEQLHGMGTTLTAAALLTDEDGKDIFAVVNVGDSRGYVFRDGALTQITSDHSFVEEMVRAGEISAEDAESHPKRNILTRALGVEPTVEVDIEIVDPQPGDRYLLCSDGLVRELGDDQIAAVLRRLKNPDEAIRDLIAQAKAHGGHDNITVVIVDVQEEGSTPEPVNHKRSIVPPRPVSNHEPGVFTFRSLVFVLLVAGLIGIAVGSVFWYARSSYYVGVEGQQVVIYQGRPEKVLWFEPTIAQRTDVMINDLLPVSVPDIQKGETQSSLDAARKYVANQVSQAAEARQVAGSPAGSTTSTTTKP